MKGRYDQLRNTLTQKAGQVQSSATVYNGHIDSLGTAMKFLQNNPALKEGAAITKKISINVQSITQLQNKKTRKFKLTQSLTAKAKS